GADAARGLRRRARDVPEGVDERARQFTGAHQRRLHLREEAYLRRGDRAPFQGDPTRQRQEGVPVRALLPRARLPAARDVRRRADLFPEDAQARAQSHRGVLRAGARLLVRGRRRAGETHLGSGSESEQVQPLGQEVSGDARAGAPGAGAAALLVVAWLVAQAPEPTALTVGRVTAVAWPPPESGTGSRRCGSTGKWLAAFSSTSTNWTARSAPRRPTRRPPTRSPPRRCCCSTAGVARGGSSH